jgi:hypothetical protein
MVYCFTWMGRHCNRFLGIKRCTMLSQYASLIWNNTCLLYLICHVFIYDSAFPAKPSKRGGKENNLNPLFLSLPIIPFSPLNLKNPFTSYWITGIKKKKKKPFYKCLMTVGKTNLYEIKKKEPQISKQQKHKRITNYDKSRAYPTKIEKRRQNDINSPLT